MKKIIPATQFKAQCLALLDRVSERHETIVISKHGRAVARLVPMEDDTSSSLIGSVTLTDPDDDLLSTHVVWEATGP